jgi:hypothetical protein
MRRAKDLVNADPRKEAFRESGEEALQRIRKELKRWSLDTNIKVEEEYDPRLELAKLAHNPGLPMQLRVQCHAEVAGFFYPKVKALELALPEGTEMQIRIMRFGKATTETAAIDVTPRKPNEPLN